MKKLLIVFLCLLLVCIGAGCGEKDDAALQTASAEPTAAIPSAEPGYGSFEALVSGAQLPQSSGNSVPGSPVSAEPAPVPTAVSTTVPTAEPTPVPTAVPAATAAAVPSAGREPSGESGEIKASPVPTAEPTPVPTAVPTPVHTAAPTPVPTAVPTPAPTATPTPAPTATPTPAAAQTVTETVPVVAGSYEGEDGSVLTIGKNGSVSYKTEVSGTVNGSAMSGMLTFSGTVREDEGGFEFTKVTYGIFDLTETAKASGYSDASPWENAAWQLYIEQYNK